MTQKRLLILSFLAMLLFQFVQMYYGGQLKARGFGIVAFELAGNEDTATTILATWDDVGRAIAWRDILWDFPYIVAYTFTLALGCLWVAPWWKNTSSVMQSIGRALAKVMVFAAACDVSENLAMLMTLQNSGAALWTKVAWIMAVMKFTVIGVTLLYLLASGVKRLQNKLRKSP